MALRSSQPGIGAEDSNQKRSSFAASDQVEKPDLSTPALRAGFANKVVEELFARDHHSVFWGDRLLTLDKSAGFLDDPAFKGAFESIRGKHVYDQYGGPGTIAWRLHTLVWAAEQALNVDGDFVECGVFKGDMS